MKLSARNRSDDLARDPSDLQARARRHGGLSFVVYRLEKHYSCILVFCFFFFSVLLFEVYKNSCHITPLRRQRRSALSHTQLSIWIGQIKAHVSKGDYDLRGIVTNSQLYSLDEPRRCSLWRLPSAIDQILHKAKRHSYKACLMIVITKTQPLVLLMHENPSRSTFILDYPNRHGFKRW